MEETNSGRTGIHDKENPQIFLYPWDSNTIDDLSSDEFVVASRNVSWSPAIVPESPINLVPNNHVASLDVLPDLKLHKTSSNQDDSPISKDGINTRTLTIVFPPISSSDDNTFKSYVIANTPTYSRKPSVNLLTRTECPRDSSTIPSLKVKDFFLSILKNIYQI